MISQKQYFKFDFANGLGGWEGGFADYPVGEEVHYELKWGWQRMPKPLDGHGLYLSGNNHSDDLFMFAKRRIEGLQPNTPYALGFNVTLATDTPTGCFGVGGAPGESVWVKAGASVIEPMPMEMDDKYYRMNIDKGNQAQGGKDAMVLGNIANSNTDCNKPVYELKSLSNSTAPFEVHTDQSGGLWVLVGTDSGFESTTSLYYASIVIAAVPQSIGIR